MSIGLTARELAQMRADIEGLLPDTCTILSATRVSDGEGGTETSWGTALANVPCRVDYKSGTEYTAGAAVQSYSKAVLSLPYRTAIDTSNRVEIDDFVWAVISVNAGQTWEAVRRAEIERIHGQF